MEDHVYSRHSIMNRNEEYLIDKKMIKSEFLRPMDKPLDLKQNAIIDKTMKQEVVVSDAIKAGFFKEENYDSEHTSTNNRLNFDSKSQVRVKSDLNTNDGNSKKHPMHTAQLMHSSVGNGNSSDHNTVGSSFGYSTNFVQTPATFSDSGSVSPNNGSIPVYTADFSALYSSGFLQLQNIGSIQAREEVVVVASEADSAAAVVKSETHDCPICQKAFNNKHNLAKHINLHTGTEKFQCSVCHKKFSEKGNMTKHMNIHTGSKTYNCPVCNKGFFWLSSLSKHKALHTGERVGKYECPICKKAFGEKGNLTKHMNVHTGNRTFACDVCNKGFYWKSSLIMHRTIHTGHKMYACPTCDKRFRWKTSFNKHMTAHLQQSTS